MARLNKEDRKQKILQAAQRVFAEKGFAGTSIKDIAREADMSPALLYTYFDSKATLYDAVLQPTQDSIAPVLREMERIGPGTEALVLCVYDAVYGSLIVKPGEEERRNTFIRLLFQSLMDGTEYALHHHQQLEDGLINNFVLECFRIAEEEQNLIHLAESPKIRMQLLIHVIGYLQLSNLPQKPIYNFEMGKYELLEDAVLFCLRGIGFTNEAIGKYFRAERLREIAERIHK